MIKEQFLSATKYADIFLIYTATFLSGNSCTEITRTKVA